MPHHKYLILFMHTLHSFTCKCSHYNAVVLCKARVSTAQGTFSYTHSSQFRSRICPSRPLHLQEAPFTAWRCHLQRFSCRITATISFGFSAACLSDRSVQLYWRVLPDILMFIELQMKSVILW